MPGPRSLYVQFSGTKELTERLRRLKTVAPLALGMALRAEGEAIIDRCVEKYVPRDLGGLAGSHFVREPMITPTGAVVVLGFGGSAVKYAARTHENPRAGKTGGVSPSGRRYEHWAKVGEWQYLAKAINERARFLPRLIGARVMRDWEALV